MTHMNWTNTATTNSSNGSSATSSITASGVAYIDPLLKQLAWDLQAEKN